MALPWTGTAGAGVVSSSESGFAVHRERLVGAAPDKVWAALIEPARWWSAAHSWSGDAANFSLDPRPGGCFCEALPKGGRGDGRGGGVVHATVIHADSPRLLRLSGALGPLQAEALTGTLGITLKPEGAGTGIGLDYVVGGFSRMPLSKVAPAVDAVLGEQLGRLAALFPAPR